MRTWTWKGALGAALSTGLLASPIIALPAVAVETPPATSSVPGDGIIINEAYLTGGSAGTPLLNKYVELYNPTDQPVDLSGWSLQYRAAAPPPPPPAVARAGPPPPRGTSSCRAGPTQPTAPRSPHRTSPPGSTPGPTAGPSPRGPGHQRRSSPRG
ncbi:lamin tail domain-containing protein [Arthrobacter sp. RIT-PI-e]|uniref:lamin tail domain-containing protein n=1 Tax=Arthrobacter sp. RIT-PI-e TaxID=1681197 RepID=UPI000AA006AF|nr:lamin tail domain-containing protein [Arthrobacter sp. RIT-PI-e]